MEQAGWTDPVPAIRRILADERNADELCEPLNLEDSMIIETILHQLPPPIRMSGMALAAGWRR